LRRLRILDQVDEQDVADTPGPHGLEPAALEAGLVDRAVALRCSGHRHRRYGGELRVLLRRGVAGGERERGDEQEQQAPGLS
jgi:hypothetical protein